jgi:hypothetical protein
MIKPRQVKMTHGKAYLIVEYDGPFQGTQTLTIDMDEVRERLRQISEALGRKPTRQDLRDVICSIVGEARKKRQLPQPPQEISSLIGVDLEA